MFSCNKEVVLPEQQMTLQIDNVEIPDIIPSLRFSGGEYKLTGSTQDESYQFEIDLGEEIESQVISSNPIQGDLDPVYARINSVNYYLTESESFSVTLEEADGYYNGSFFGSLINQSNNHIELQGSFNNL